MFGYFLAAKEGQPNGRDEYAAEDTRSIFADLTGGFLRPSLSADRPIGVNFAQCDNVPGAFGRRLGMDLPTSTGFMAIGLAGTNVPSQSRQPSVPSGYQYTVV